MYVCVCVFVCVRALIFKVAQINLPSDLPPSAHSPRVHPFGPTHLSRAFDGNCQIGDSVRDIEEGKNAGCGLVVGVLSGADSAEDLLAAGADLIAERLTDLPVPAVKEDMRAYQLPDLS